MCFISTTCTCVPRGSQLVFPVHELWMVFRSAVVPILSTSLPGQYPDQFVPILAQPHVGVAQATNLLASVHDGRVILTAEGLADLRQAMFGQFLGQRHRN